MIIACIILTIVGLVGVISFFVWKNEETDKWSKLYVVVAVVVLASTAFLGLLVPANPSFWFGIEMFVWAVLGGVHTWLMYRQGWSKRNSRKAEQDSFWPECLYTMGIGVLGSAAFLAVFWWLRPEWSGVFSMTTLSFLTGFLGLKAYDRAHQVLPSNFEIKWVFPPESYDVSTVGQGKTRVIFRLATSWDKENKPLSKKVKIWVEVPDSISLANAFRIAIEEDELYVKNNPDREKDQIRDFGFESGSQEHWWLFYVQIVPWRPTSWFRKVRYVNPDATLEQNMLRHEDVIAAKRMIY